MHVRRLTAQEKAEVVAKCDHLRKPKFSPALPYAFTEHGAVMLASVGRRYLSRAICWKIRTPSW
jgi:hypothetical protein